MSALPGVCPFPTRPKSIATAFASGFDPAIREFSKPSAVPGVHWSVRWPLPAAKTRTLVVNEGLLQFFSTVHYEWAVLGDRFANGSALQQQYLGHLGAVPSSAQHPRAASLRPSRVR